MKLNRALKVLGKDLRLGPRSPLFLWILLIPVIFTLVLQLAFGSLFDPKPRFGIVDHGESVVTESASLLPGIDLKLFDDPYELKKKVEGNDLDAGLVLQEGFDEALQAGERPALEFYVGGESHASNRIILAVTAIDLVRKVEGNTPPVDVVVTSYGDEVASIAVRLVPLIVMYSLVMAAVFLPAFGIADEREKRTLEALVVTPVKLSEVITAKGIMGVLLAVAMSIVTLLLNQALGADPLTLLVVILIAAILCVQIGLIFGTASKDATMVFALIKGTGIFIFGPAMFYIFPNWPQWIAKIFPTYWVINPIYQVALNDAGFSDIGYELLIAAGIIIVLGTLVSLMTKRLAGKLAVG